MQPERVIKSYIDNNGIKIVFIAQKADISKDLLSKRLDGKRKLRPKRSDLGK